MAKSKRLTKRVIEDSEDDFSSGSEPLPRTQPQSQARPKKKKILRTRAPEEERTIHHHSEGISALATQPKIAPGSQNIKILSLYDDGTMRWYVDLEGVGPVTMANAEMKRKHPQQVIEFYEERIQFED